MRGLPRPGASIVDPNAWLHNRRAFLRELLAGDPSDEERAAIEAELAVVEEEIRSRKLTTRLRRMFGRDQPAGGGDPPPSDQP